MNSEMSIWRGFWWEGHFRYGEKVQGWIGAPGVIVSEGSFRDLIADNVSKFNLKLQNKVSEAKLMADGSTNFSNNKRKLTEI